MTPVRVEGADLDVLLEREWLTANGIGGYASSTLPGLNTRKYHGLLVAAMAPPVRRMVILSRVEESLWCGGKRYALDCNEYPGVIYPQGFRHLREFHAGGRPRWVYEIDGCVIEKELRLVRGANTVVVTYTLVSGGAVDLQLRPLFAMRGIHDLSYQFNGRLATEDRGPNHHRVAPTNKTPEVFFAHDGEFTAAPNWYINQIYRREQQRGYSGLEDLWTPGPVRYRLAAESARCHLACSTDPIELGSLLEEDVEAPRIDTGDSATRVLRAAADAFVVSSRVPGERWTECIAGYPWFGPASREALIGFTGLMLVPGRFEEAKSFLLSLAGKMRGGVMPSAFPENGAEAVYDGADISLWYAAATWDYLRYTGDEATGRRLLEVILKVIDAYRAGTSLGIGVDGDGLLFSGAPGTATSWMDATVCGGAVTPRAGMPVELNALWYNAIRVAAELCGRFDRPDRAKSLSALAGSVARAFNARFWNADLNCCYDVIGEGASDASVRPNQLLAVSLAFPVLGIDRHDAVLGQVREKLLTPFGVRTLAPDAPAYQGRYAGDVPVRDRALHNGSAFPWLMGPYVNGLLKVRGHNDVTRAMAHELLRPCIEYAQGAGMGQLPELFDGDAPHAAGGAPASAASVGEVLRCYFEDVLGLEPAANVDAARGGSRPAVRPTAARRAAPLPPRDA